MKYVLLVFGMGLVTYLPRMLPIVFLNNINLPSFWQNFLRFVPYAALGALIFPGILYSAGNVASAVCGGLVSLILAILRVNITLVVLGGIAGVYLWNLIM